MLRYRLILILILPFLLSWACASSWEIERQKETSVAGTMIGTLTALAGTREAEKVATLTPSPTCVTDVLGKCVDEFLSDQELLLTQQAMLLGPKPTPFNIAELIPICSAKVKGKKAVPTYGKPGLGTEQEGRIWPGINWPVYRFVSGWISESRVKGHYVSTYLTCWLEFIDMDKEMTKTTGIEHAWEHKAQKHAHCQTESGQLIAQIWPGLPILQVLEVDKDREVAKVVLDEIWIEENKVSCK